MIIRTGKGRIGLKVKFKAGLEHESKQAEDRILLTLKDRERTGKEIIEALHATRVLTLMETVGE